MCTSTRLAILASVSAILVACGGAEVGTTSFPTPTETSAPTKTKMLGRLLERVCYVTCKAIHEIHMCLFHGWPGLFNTPTRCIPHIFGISLSNKIDVLNKISLNAT